MKTTLNSIQFSRQSQQKNTSQKQSKNQANNFVSLGYPEHISAGSFGIAFKGVDRSKELDLLDQELRKSKIDFSKVKEIVTEVVTTGRERDKSGIPDRIEGLTQGGRDVVHLVRSFLGADVVNEYTRYSAIEAFKKHGGPEHIKYLKPLLIDKSKDIITKADDAIKTINSKGLEERSITEPFGLHYLDKEHVRELIEYKDDPSKVESKNSVKDYLNREVAKLKKEGITVLPKEGYEDVVNLEALIEELKERENKSGLFHEVSSPEFNVYSANNVAISKGGSAYQVTGKTVSMTGGEVNDIYADRAEIIGGKVNNTIHAKESVNLVLTSGQVNNIEFVGDKPGVLRLSSSHDIERIIDGIKGSIKNCGTIEVPEGTKTEDKKAILAKCGIKFETYHSQHKH